MIPATTEIPNNIPTKRLQEHKATPFLPAESTSFKIIFLSFLAKRHLRLVKLLLIFKPMFVTSINFP